MKKSRLILPRLKLDLLQPTPYQQPTMLVFVLGALLAISITGYFLYALQHIDAIERTARLSREPVHSRRPVNPDEAKTVKAGIERLALPWGNLFTALEAADQPKVHLISVAPDPQKSTVRIIAEAPDVYEMLEYVRGLASQSKLKDVYLVQHEVHDQDPNQPVRFTLTASWEQKS